MRACVCVLGAAQLINKLNGEDFNEADEQLFEVCTSTACLRPCVPAWSLSLLNSSVVVNDRIDITALTAQYLLAVN